MAGISLKNSSDLLGGLDRGADPTIGRILKGTDDGIAFIAQDRVMVVEVRATHFAMLVVHILTDALFRDPLFAGLSCFLVPKYALPLVHLRRVSLPNDPSIADAAYKGPGTALVATAALAVRDLLLSAVHAVCITAALTWNARGGARDEVY